MARKDEEMPPEEEEVGPYMRHIHALKLYVINCGQWTNERLNLLSVNLLLICTLIDCVGQLSHNFLWEELESLVNLSTMFLGSLILLLTVPLFIDVAFLLTQRVNPGAAASLLQDEIRHF